METINALHLRNHLGDVLDRLEKTRMPVLISKGKHVRAALITIEDFQIRFLDRQAEERRREILDRIMQLRHSASVPVSTLEVLRDLRGYTT